MTPLAVLLHVNKQHWDTTQHKALTVSSSNSGLNEGSGHHTRGDEIKITKKKKKNKCHKDNNKQLRFVICGRGLKMSFQTVQRARSKSHHFCKRDKKNCILSAQIALRWRLTVEYLAHESTLTESGVFLFEISGNISKAQVARIIPANTINHHRPSKARKPAVRWPWMQCCALGCRISGCACISLWTWRRSGAN